MMTKYFRGNYILAIGQSFAILSIDETATDFISEKIIFFEGADGNVHTLSHRMKYPKIIFPLINTVTVDQIDIIKSNITTTIFSKYSTQLASINYNYNVNLVEETNSLISLLLHKFPAFMNSVETQSMNFDLRALITRYKSVVVITEGFIQL
jgi:hypothetical protein